MRQQRHNYNWLQATNDSVVEIFGMDPKSHVRILAQAVLAAGREYSKGICDKYHILANTS